MGGSPTTAVMARARIAFLLRGTAEDSPIHPRPRFRVKTQNSSRVGWWRRPARRSLLGGAALGRLVLRVSGAEVGERPSAASPSRGFSKLRPWVFAAGFFDNPPSGFPSVLDARAGGSAASGVSLRRGENRELCLFWVMTGTCPCSRMSAQRPDGAAPSSLGEKIGVFFGVGRQVAGSQSYDPAALSACRPWADPRGYSAFLLLVSMCSRLRHYLQIFHVPSFVCSSVRCVVSCSVNSLLSFSRSCLVALCNPGRLMALLI